MKTVASVLNLYAAREADQNIAILLSGGIDSASVLFSLIDAKKNVTCYTFMLDGILSTDFAMARHLCKRVGTQFVPIFLPTNYDVIMADLRTLAAMGAKTKTDFECAWPLLYCYKQIKERSVYSGMGADGHFCISKKGMIHWRDRIDAFRQHLYSSPRYAQAGIHRSIAASHGKHHTAPFMTPEMRAVFVGTTWADVNKPKQKQPIIDALGSRARLLKKINPHTNLQLGDSGIAKHLGGLVNTKYNRWKYKSVTGIYNQIALGS